MSLFTQQLLKRQKLKRKDVQQLITRGQQLQAEEGLGETLQQDLQSLENTLSKMEQNMDSQEQSLGVGIKPLEHFRMKMDLLANSDGSSRSWFDDRDVVVDRSRWPPGRSSTVSRKRSASSSPRRGQRWRET